MMFILSIIERDFGSRPSESQGILSKWKGGEPQREDITSTHVLGTPGRIRRDILNLESLGYVFS